MHHPLMILFFCLVFLFLCGYSMVRWLNFCSCICWGKEVQTDFFIIPCHWIDIIVVGISWTFVGIIASISSDLDFGLHPAIGDNFCPLFGIKSRSSAGSVGLLGCSQKFSSYLNYSWLTYIKGQKEMQMISNWMLWLVSRAYYASP